MCRKTRRVTIGLLTSLIVLIALGGIPSAMARGSSASQQVTAAFTYQGYLEDTGGSVDGACDMQFSLYDAAVDGELVSGPLTESAVNTVDGYFTVALDFGASPFAGEARWLSIAVRCPAGVGTYTLLEPRQTLTAVPYALHAAVAPWSGLTGVPSGFADGVDDVAAVVVGASVYAGDGLTLAAAGDAITLSVAFAGAGTAVTVSRSDHTHAGIDITSPVAEAQTAQSAPWSGITGVPGDLLDGDDDVLGDLTCSEGQVVQWSGGVWVCGSGGTGGLAWSLTGNAGTIPGLHMLGTTDAVSLTLAVNGIAALRLAPTSGTPNLLGGYAGNVAGAGRVGVTIGGGGASGYPQTAGGDYAFIGGGRGHEALGSYSTIAGGDRSDADASFSTVGGGQVNHAEASYSTIGGGSYNQARGTGSVISGGAFNTTDGQDAVVPGGYDNHAAGDYSFAAGRQAYADHNGSFVWADASSYANFTSLADNQMRIRAAGGVDIQVGSAEVTVNGAPVLTAAPNQPPVAVLQADLPGGYLIEGETATLSLTLSYDPEGEPLTYAFDPMGQTLGLPGAYGGAATAAVTYNVAGDYLAAGWVRDSGGVYARSQALVPVWGFRALTVDSAGDESRDASLAVVDRRPAVAYYDDTNDDLKYVRARDAAGTTWGTPLTVDSAAYVVGHVSLAVVDGCPAVAYHDFASGNLKYVRATDAAGTTWGAPLTVGSIGDNLSPYDNPHPSLAVVDGHPAVAYYDTTNDDLKYVRAQDAAGTS